MNIEIIGYGWVGKAMDRLFSGTHKIRITDPLIKDIVYEDGTFDGSPDVSIICVPTPLNGKVLDCSIVRDTVLRSTARLIIIRSTVMPGVTAELHEKKLAPVVFWPEYLGETVEHPLTDQKARQFGILGGTPEGRRMAIELLMTVYNASLNIRQVDSTTAEIIKLSENRAIAYKVAQCQELYDACEAAGVDYYEVRQAVYGDDPRFNLWWTAIYAGKRGFNSKCIPKDVYAWLSWAESAGIDPKLTRELLAYNEDLLKD